MNTQTPNRGSQPARPCETWTTTEVGRKHQLHPGLSVREEIAKDMLAAFVAAGGHETLESEGYEPSDVEDMLIGSAISLADKLIAKLEATK